MWTHLLQISHWHQSKFKSFLPQLNPHKWKKYSLEDVDTSDRTNSLGAFQFLQEIEKRREQETMMLVEEEENTDKIVFKRKSTRRNEMFNKSVKLQDVAENDSGEVDKAILRGSKLLMPEYVIGQKVKKSNKKKEQSAATTIPSTASVLKLGHLFEEEDLEE